MRTAADFWAFSKAGRALGELHVGYEKVPEHPAKVEGPAKPTASHYRVEKMRFGRPAKRTEPSCSWMCIGCAASD